MFTVVRSKPIESDTLRFSMTCFHVGSPAAFGHEVSKNTMRRDNPWHPSGAILRVIFNNDWRLRWRRSGSLEASGKRRCAGMGQVSRSNVAPKDDRGGEAWHRGPSFSQGRRP